MQKPRLGTSGDWKGMHNGGGNEAAVPSQGLGRMWAEWAIIPNSHNSQQRMRGNKVKALWGLRETAEQGLEGERQPLRLKGVDRLTNWPSSRDRRRCPWTEAAELCGREADARIKAWVKLGLGFKALQRTQWIRRNTEYVCGGAGAGAIFRALCHFKTGFISVRTTGNYFTSWWKCIIKYTL